MVTRKYPRFPVTMQSTLVHSDHFRHAGSIRDISTRGCRVDSIISPFTGMQMAVLLHIPGEATPIAIEKATVRWCGSAGIGMEFLTVAAPHQERLNRMLQQLGLKPGPARTR